MTIQQVFIANLKKYRKIKGFSQMTLAGLCDMNGNYIGQIEMGRRIPSFEKIEKIAAALEIPYHELFVTDTIEKRIEQKIRTDDYLKKMPAHVKRELISRLTTALKKDIGTSLNPLD